jgi:hypothetical protein
MVTCDLQWLTARGKPIKKLQAPMVSVRADVMDGHGHMR